MSSEFNNMRKCQNLCKILVYFKTFYLDHDHLWFDPNWKHIGSNSSTCNNRKMNGSTHGHGIPSEEDPMAAMLENNAKNKNATNIFLNQLHNMKQNEKDDDENPEYAEVDGIVNEKQSILITDVNQGPYATTTLVNPPRTSSNHAVSQYQLIVDVYKKYSRMK